MGPIRPIEDLLAELIELKEPAEREAYLNNVCGEDTALRGQLQNLLAAKLAVSVWLFVPGFVWHYNPLLRFVSHVTETSSAR